MTKAMRQMSSLFAVVGGPLDYIFANALDKRSAPATGAVIEDDGISGYVDGKRVLAGTIDYMIRHGITVHADKSNTENGADTTKVMYAADGNTVYAKFYIRYSFSEEFSALLPELREKNIVPLIYTRDPNISNDLLRTLTMGNTKMRVMKRFDLPETEEKNYLRISAGVVTFGDKMNAIRTILIAKKYSELQSKISKLELCCMAVGSAAAVVCSLVRLPIPSLLGAVWQALFCGALYLVVKNLLAHGKKIKENSNDQNVNE
jgi:hypothetical protein